VFIAVFTGLPALVLSLLALPLVFAWSWAIEMAIEMAERSQLLGWLMITLIIGLITGVILLIRWLGRGTGNSAIGARPRWL